MKKAFLFLMLFFIINPLGARAQNLIIQGATLDLNRCIEIALKKQPDILAAINTIRVFQSRVGQAQAGYYPQIDLTSHYLRSDFSSSTSNRNGLSSNGSSGTSGGPHDEYSNNISLNQMLFDFGKTATGVQIQALNLDASRSDSENIATQIVFGVKQAYYALLKAQRDLVVAQQTVQQYQQHLEQAKGFFEVGTRAKFDVTKAEVDLSNAQLNLIKAQNALQIAKVTLNNAIGLPEAPEYQVEDNLQFQKYEVILEDALQSAYDHRPDLQSLVAQKQAASQSIELAKKNYYPVLSGNANYGWLGETLPFSHGWDVGLSVSFPIFTGFLTKHQVEEARATLEVQKANEDRLRQQIYLEIKEAWLNLLQAKELVSTAEITVKQANENLELATGRYEVGVGNPIEVSDSLVAQSNAKTAYISALYDYKVAQASLEKAMGKK